jgi:prepilin-type N-terminal cleavage/methylation domain-containing protein
MKKGFTLAELLGVVVIISILALLVLPPIINQIKNSTTKINDATLKIISEATYLFMDSNKGVYPIAPTTNYCITLQQLVDADKLSPPILDSSGSSIALTKIVAVEITTLVDIEYSLVDTCPF